MQPHTSLPDRKRVGCLQVTAYLLLLPLPLWLLLWSSSVLPEMANASPECSYPCGEWWAAFLILVPGSILFHILGLIAAFTVALSWRRVGDLALVSLSVVPALWIIGSSVLLFFPSFGYGSRVWNLIGPVLLVGGAVSLASLLIALFVRLRGAIHSLRSPRLRTRVLAGMSGLFILLIAASLLYWAGSVSQKAWRLREQAVNKSIDIANYSPDGKRIVAVRESRWASIWDAATGEKLEVLREHSVDDAQFSPDGKQILTSNFLYGAPMLWDAATAKPLSEVPPTLSGSYAAFSPDGKQIVTISGNDVIIRQAGTSEPIHELKGHTDTVWAAKFSPDGTKIVTSSSDKTARIWDARTGSLVAVLSGHSEYLYKNAGFDRDGERVFTADGSVRIWDAKDGRLLITFSDSTIRAAFSPDGKALATASRDGTVRIWEPSSANLFQSWVSGSSIYSITYSPDGAFILTGQDDGSMRIWDAGNGRMVRELRERFSLW